MIALTVEIKDAEELLRLRNGQKRMVYAIANATRATALEIQKSERAAVQVNFTLRPRARTFILNQSAIITFPQPKAGIVEARVRVGQRTGLLLSQYEAGFTREPRRGKKVAIPAAARPSKTADIPSDLYIRALALRRSRSSRRRRAGEAVQRAAIMGLHGTYVTPGGIFQRIGRGASRLLYAFKAPFHVAPRLNFIATARATTNRFFGPELRRQVVEAFHYAGLSR